MLCLVHLLIVLRSILSVIWGAHGCTLTNVVLVHACGTTLWPDKSQTVTHQDSGGNHPALSFETNPFFNYCAYNWNWSCCFHFPLDYSFINEFLSPTHVILRSNSIPLPTLMCLGEFTCLKRKMGLKQSYNTHSIQSCLMMFWLLVKIRDGNIWSWIRCDSFDRQSLAASCNVATNGFHPSIQLLLGNQARHTQRVQARYC